MIIFKAVKTKILNLQIKLQTMKKMYHYATVEKALEELKEKGFSID